MNIFITGVSSGIGFGLAKAYLEKGHHVFGLSRRTPPALPDFPRFSFRQVDLARTDTIPGSLSELLRNTGHLDLAILNAGVLGKIGDLRDTSLDEMKRVMDVNLWANKVLIDALLALPAGVSRIVAISSGAAINPGRGWNAYSISKVALNTMISLYAAETPKVHFCAFAPGIVDTAMQDQISALPKDAPFDSLEYLQEAKGTELMPGPEQAAARLISAIERAGSEPSGAFVDVHEVTKRTLTSFI